MRFFREVSLSATTAGFIAVLVALTSSVAIIFQAASAFGATPAQMSSWLLAIGVGVGLINIGLSLSTRTPVMVAWSLPGAALLSTAGIGIPMAEGIGAFVVYGAMALLAGATGWFERVMDRIPIGLASALLAGVLTRFGIEAFAAARSAPLLVIVMLATYLAGRRLWPRYAIVGVLAVGVAVALAEGRIHGSGIAWQLAAPVWTTPQFTLRSAISIALPLFIVTMASQNLPGVAAIRAGGFDRPPLRVPISRTIGWTGAVTVLLAPFGAYALNLSATTAAICLGPEAHPDPARRYPAAVVCGLLYCVMGLFASAMVGLLLAFPRELVSAVAGLALLGTIAAGLQLAMHDDRHREPALLTFLITLSGVTLLGVGSAFWGVIAGVLALGVQRFRRG